MSLPYTRIVQPYNDENEFYYVSKVLELDGCHSDGETETEALENLKEAMELWIESAIAHNDHIPEPINVSGYNGKFLLRLPKSLHQRLAVEAEKEGVSLNQYALYKLSR